MQSRFLPISDIKLNYPSLIQFDKELSFRNLTLETILSDEPLTFYFHESIKDFGNFEEAVKPISHESIKSICLKEIVNILQNRLDVIKLQIEENSESGFEKLFKRMLNKTDLTKLYEEQSIVQAMIANPALIDKKIVIDLKIISPDTLVGIPFYSLELNDTVYVVSNNFNSYLDIIKYKVSEITIVSTDSDPEFNTDFEFNYLLKDEKNMVLKIPHNTFRNFNGAKTQINDKFLFINVEDAKNHCILVLNNLKNNIVEKIQAIKEYE